MRKILLSIFIMIFGFQGAAISAELIDMDSGNALSMQVKVEALERALNNLKETPNVGDIDDIDKNNFMGLVSEEYLLNNRLTLGGIFRACMNSTQKGVFCMPFVREVVKTHNLLVSRSTLPHGKLTEQEFDSIVSRAIDCPPREIHTQKDYSQIDFGAVCYDMCKRLAVENICYLRGIDYVYYTEGICTCNDPHGVYKDRIHFIPSYSDYLDVVRDVLH